MWEAPKLIIQLDNMLNQLCKNNNVMDGERFGLSYDLIVLDDRESLMSRLGEGTMNKKEIGIWLFFNKIMKNSQRNKYE